ncbi:Fe(3+) ABC transporter substrate-binding protein [Zavarzinia sp. CC-PAN008]|uniref:Fe(3+) ABC transporter substrate-binding protein n=1 Tax=Zavarzinia sp. CC-PAN008 TaxID=3243332 RepID=UPI003F7475DE
MRSLIAGLGLLVMGAGAAGTLAPVLAGSAQAAEINIYSSRHYPSDDELFGKFQEQTGISVNLVKGSADELRQRLKLEGENSPADVFITVDAGNLVRAMDDGLFAKTDSAVLNERIPAHFREADGSWFTFATRARVIVYSKERVKPEELSTYEDLADPKWKGRLLLRTSNHPYNQALIASIITRDGLEAAETWAKGMVANLARKPEGGDTDQIKAIAAGVGDIAVVNHYYFARLSNSDKPEDREVVAKLGIFFPGQDSYGMHVNVSGGGVTAHAPHPAEAVKFLEYLSSPEAQAIFAKGNYEYPVVAGAELDPTVASWGTFKVDTQSMDAIGRNIPEALKLTDRVGWP